MYELTWRDRKKRKAYTKGGRERHRKKERKKGWKCCFKMNFFNFVQCKVSAYYTVKIFKVCQERRLT